MEDTTEAQGSGSGLPALTSIPNLHLIYFLRKGLLTTSTREKKGSSAKVCENFALDSLNLNWD